MYLLFEFLTNFKSYELLNNAESLGEQEAIIFLGAKRLPILY